MRTRPRSTACEPPSAQGRLEPEPLETSIVTSKFTSRHQAPFRGLLVAVVALLPAGCALVRPPPPEPEPEPRPCEEVNEGRLPPAEDLLQVSEINRALAATLAEDDEVLVTVAADPDGEQIRIYPTDSQPGQSAALWPLAIRDLLRTPLPEGVSPAVRVRLVPGPEGGVALEPSIFCPPVLENRDELVERYLYQTRELADPGHVVAHLQLSELGVIQEVDVELPEDRQELDILARRALHFARFQPAILDGRPQPFTVRVVIP